MGIEISTTKVNQPVSYATAAAGGAAFGLVIGGATALVTRGRSTTPALTRILVGAGAFAGVALATNALSGGRLGDQAFDMSWGQRHQIGFAVRNLHRFGIVRETMHAYDDARVMQHGTWGPKMHVDDGIDAVRHAYGAGMLAARLIHNQGMSAEAAQAIVAEVGMAHELDGVDNNDGSSRMDDHNNRAGARIGAELATTGMPTAAAMFERITRAAGDGDLRVLDEGILRATTASDVPEPSS